jgi:hypothetical protein
MAFFRCSPTFAGAHGLGCMNTRESKLQIFLPFANDRSETGALPSTVADGYGFFSPLKNLPALWL